MTALALFAAKNWRIFAALALAAASVWLYLHWRDVQRDVGATAERAEWQARIDAQKAEAAELLADAKMRVEKAEGVAATLRQDQDLKDAQNVQTIAGYERRLATAGRLRDPNASPARCGSGGASPGPQSAIGASTGADDTTEAPGLLSADLSGLLRTLTREADELNNAYITSRADAAQLRVLLASCTPVLAPTTP